MTQDEIIRSPLGREQLVALAREAGFSIKTINSIDGDEVFWFTNITDMIERFAALVAAHEREACAKVCDGIRFHLHKGDFYAAVIRARGK